MRIKIYLGNQKYNALLLNEMFSGPGDSPGDVSGERFGTGALISDELFLTAGHCFDQSGGGWERPRRVYFN